ncbi:MAG: hypothetical protein ACKVWV_15620 [Planctomycetota bacterium]
MQSVGVDRIRHDGHDRVLGRVTCVADLPLPGAWVGACLLLVGAVLVLWPKIAR